MITIHSFKEMADRHQSGEIPYRIVQEIAYVLLGLCNYVGRDIAEPVGVTQQEVDWLLTLPKEIDFMTYMGGNVFICETEADLSEVVGMDFGFCAKHGRWPNVTEAVLAWDDCRYLFNADGTADYALLFAATNNAGGPSWFIPQQHWQPAQIEVQIEANHQFWAKSVAQA